MKHLILIGGPMGVGKTTVSQLLKNTLSPSVFLDGDWCWDANPFIVNRETKAMVTSNIVHLLRAFLDCSAYEYVIFCWVMHLPEVIDTIRAAADGRDCQIHALSLTATPDALRARIEADVAQNLRTPDALARSIAYLPLYQALPTHKIDTTDRSPKEVVDEILAAIHPTAHEKFPQ